MTDILLPKHKGPDVPTSGTYANSLRVIGRAPNGWKYLKLGDEIPAGAIILVHGEWGMADTTVWNKIYNFSWPHAIPTKPPKLSPIGQVKKILDENPSLAKEIIGLALEKLA